MSCGAIASAGSFTNTRRSHDVCRVSGTHSPYDLRHAAVSTWLNGGVAPTQVAEWAGHSVAVLLEVYAKCLDGQEHVALKRLGDALGPARLTQPVAPDDPS